ncbi:MAG: SirA-like protein [Syntrophorhabdus sp. PtaU1.Bin058]|nr:MAG: SirA-like protein [Syntrophorhabdus sp. PtaU1.Bin058]
MIITMEKLDLRGKTCPVPVIETKKLIDSKSVEEIEVLVDNSTASENVQRFLTSGGFAVQCKEAGGEYCIHGTKKAGEVKSQEQTGKVLAFVNSETMGIGNDELGAILMRSFLNTLKEIKPLPWRVIFVNAGVKLACEDSPVLNVLKDLEGIGIEILACGTCLDYFKLKERLHAGRTSNMFEIISSMVEATNVIKP